MLGKWNALAKVPQPTIATRSDDDLGGIFFGAFHQGSELASYCWETTRNPDNRYVLIVLYGHYYTTILAFVKTNRRHTRCPETGHPTERVVAPNSREVNQSPGPGCLRRIPQYGEAANLG
jgi:hypothetical protein